MAFLCNSKNLKKFLEKFDNLKFLSGYYMRGKFAGIFENRIYNLQITFKETSVQPQSERDNNRRRQWEQVAGRGTGGIPMGILPSASIEKNKYEYKYKKTKR